MLVYGSRALRHHFPQFRELVQELAMVTPMQPTVQRRTHGAVRRGFAQIQSAADVEIFHDHFNLNPGLASVRFKRKLDAGLLFGPQGATLQRERRRQGQPHQQTQPQARARVTDAHDHSRGCDGPDRCRRRHSSDDS